jgi:hypothetical protein
MLPEVDHAAHVDQWLSQAARALAPPELVTLFEMALSALWRRAEVTLGEVTLTAIVDRVLYTASETYPLLGTLRIENGAPSFDEFRPQGEQDPTLVEAVRLVLVDFLTVLGHLTDEILTPALHAELSRIALVEPRAAQPKNVGAKRPRS